MSNPARTGGRPCKLCSLPEVNVINEARTRDKLTYPQIHGYILDVLGHADVTIHHVNAHFKNGLHHEAKK